MAILNLFSTNSTHPREKADAKAKGATSSTGSFSLERESGDVLKNKAYWITQGQKVPAEDDPKYQCTAVVVSGPSETKWTFQPIPTKALSDSLRERYLATALQAAARAAQKTVTIHIAENDLRDLKTNGYKLCFAKKVGDEDYNVVWQSYRKYSVNDTFSWVPQYQLFGSNQFNDEVMADITTNLVTIGLGEVSVLDSSGVLDRPSSGGPNISISMDNQYGSIHPGVAQLSTGIDGTQTSTPIYIAPKSIVEGRVVLTPVEKVLVWFEQDIETSTMFSTARSKPIEIDLTFSSAESRLYQNQQWSTPPA